MITQVIDEIFSKLTAETSPPMGKSQLKALLTSRLRNLDLVTREEFDAQTAVLDRTRQKLQQLEQKLAELENAEGGHDWFHTLRVFNNAKSEINQINGNSDGLIIFPDNFRSGKKVIDFFNKFFANTFKEGAIQY